MIGKANLLLHASYFLLLTSYFLLLIFSLHSMQIYILIPNIMRNM